MAIGESYVLHDSSMPQSLPSQGEAFVLVWASWSEPSREFRPIFDEVAKELGNNGLWFATRTTADLVAVPSLGPLVIPAVIFFQNEVVVKKLQGAQTRSQLRQWIDECCNGGAQEAHS